MVAPLVASCTIRGLSAAPGPRDAARVAAVAAAMATA
jgi:hypothetical protein